MRRGRGFNAQEVANLRSWGVEPRPDEIERGFETPTHPGLAALVGARQQQRSAVELAADQRRRAADSRRAAEALQNRLDHPELI